MKLLKIILLVLLFIFTYGVETYHVGVFPAPPISDADRAAVAQNPGRFIPKTELGIHQLILTGPPYARGVASGKLTHDLIYLQEKDLISQLNRFFPSLSIFKALEIPAIRWFNGIDRYFEPSVVQEVQGVAETTSHDFDFLADRLTRQISYHGLHEVGQMMVDQTGDDMGCTVVALPTQKGWYIGRNFDFEAGRIFDTEKIMKWVFPDQGYAFVSVIWAGMVGAVTGVNENGVYLSLNAAGSTDWVRWGTPSTIILLKALQFSKTADEAVKIIQDEQMFITDIFVVSDRQTQKLYRVEKSPNATEVFDLKTPSAVTNHLISPHWQDDRINVFRRDELTSHYRADRGEQLLKELESKSSSLKPETMELAILNILRDKGEENGKPLALGNRRAIDALIATHSVIYNSPQNYLYVSKGPSLAGAFVGFDLTRSFKTRTPIVVRTLPADPALSETLYPQVKLAVKKENEASHLAKQGRCAQADDLLSEAKGLYPSTYTYQSALGDFFACQGETEKAKQAWQAALYLSPAYDREVKQLKKKIDAGKN